MILHYIVQQLNMFKNKYMTTEQLVEFGRTHSWVIKTGAKQVALRKHCTVEQVYEARRILKKERNTRKYNSSVPKILLFDIETAPMQAYVWGRWKQNISLSETISEWFVICWSAKWLYADEVMSGCLTPKEALKEDDSRIVKDLWKLFDEADIIVAHNGNYFDIPRMNSRFVINGLPSPSPYFRVDTCNVAKKQFGFSSNKLDALAGYFDIPCKLDTTFELWRDCLKGDQEALDYMVTYNKKDVEILEQVYLRLRSYIKGHPNVANLVNKDCCSVCGCEELTPIEGKYYYNSISKYPLYRCTCCGSIVRGRKSITKGPSTVNICR